MLNNMYKIPKRESDLIRIKVPISYLPKVYGFIEKKSNRFKFYCTKCEEIHTHGAVKGTGGPKSSYGHRCCHCEDKSNYPLGYLLYSYSELPQIKGFLNDKCGYNKKEKDRKDYRNFIYLRIDSRRLLNNKLEIINDAFFH